jgi:murein hydrolase activator
MSAGHAQTRQDLKRRLNQNKRQLELSKKTLKETLAQKKSTLKTLSIYERQIELREEGLKNLQDNLDVLEVDIQDAKDEISGITKEIERIKVAFSEAVVLSYKNNKKMSKMHYVFMANNFNDLIRRLNYLKKIMNFRRLQLTLIENKKQENSVKINQLVKKQKSLGVVYSEKAEETNQLNNDKKEYSDLVTSLKSKEDQLLQEIARREQRSKELEANIRKAIVSNKGDRRLEGFVPGALPWPVKSGYISERFGLHKHQDFKYVKTQNNGVNIICESNSDVSPVFNGVVTAIIEVPGMQTSVLVKHGSYYSVYANLSSISCVQGETVTASSIIGQVGKNTDNVTELHFEIWKGTTKMNPETWIRKS